MGLMERVYSVLTVSRKESFADSLAFLLPEKKFDPVINFDSGAAARRAMIERDFDLIIIDFPLSDESGARLAIEAVRNRKSVALIVVSADKYTEVFMKVAEYGVFTLMKPLPAREAERAIEWMCVTRERLRGYERAEKSVSEKMEEIRLVNRAKWILIDVLGMSENDAHRYIEKQAMDRCVTKSEVARGIISTYE